MLCKKHEAEKVLEEVEKEKRNLRLAQTRLALTQEELAQMEIKRVRRLTEIDAADHGVLREIVEKTAVQPWSGYGAALEYIRRLKP